MLIFFNMRALLILIAYDPSPVYFLGLIFKTTEIKVYLKHTSYGRLLGKFPTSSPPPASPPSYRTYTLGTFATYQIHTPHSTPYKQFPTKRFSEEKSSGKMISLNNFPSFCIYSCSYTRNNFQCVLMCNK